MRFVPTYCDVCASSSLVAADGIFAERTQCRECGAEMRTVRSMSYSADDMLIYATLADTLADAGLTPLAASRLLEELDGKALGNRTGATFANVAKALPALAQLESSVSTLAFPMRKAEAMLRTILAAHSTRRHESGLLPKVSLTERKWA